MISSQSIQKEFIRLRTRSSLCEATYQMNMVKTRQTPVSHKETRIGQSETDVDDVTFNSPPRATPPRESFSSDSEKLDFLCREMAKVAGITQDVKELRRINAEKDKRINELETRIG